MRLAGDFAAGAKNQRPDTTGHSARQRVFGKTERFPGSVVDAMQDGEDPNEMDAGWRDPVLRRASELRHKAKQALIQMDADQRWKRALSAGVRRSLREWKPGEQVFFWRAQKATQPLRGRRARMFSSWHGPALVLGRAVGLNDLEGCSYWVAHNSNLLLVAQEHLRAATLEEALADEVMSQLLNEVQETMQRDRHQLRFRDLGGRTILWYHRKPPNLKWWSWTRSFRR